MNKKYIIYSLVISGVLIGGITLVAWRRRAAIIATSFIDEMEIGDNQGFADQAFQQMLEDVGWQGGEAWCMYFVIAVYNQAFPKKADAIRKVLNGSTQQSLKNIKDHPELFKLITDGSKAQSGDILIWQSINNANTGHAGILIKNLSHKTGRTVEGNSGLGGTREGQGVTQAQRSLEIGTVQGSLKLIAIVRLKL